jgi:riboflavin kinase/FMN adenylyltransferase
MKVFFSLAELKLREKPIVTLGTFDGVHLGHQAILKELAKEKREKKRDTLLVTYEPHPQSVVSPENSTLMLSTLEEKLKLLQELPEGKELSGVLVLKFTREFSFLSADDFIEEILLNRLKIGELIIGENHAFGKNRSGGIELLKKASMESDFKLRIVPSVMMDSVRISSSRIRKELSGGDFENACRMLGHRYLMLGKRTRGKGIGKEIGYPTINIEVPEKKLLPRKGVYGVEVEMRADYPSQAGTTRRDEKYYGMMYFGRKLTLEEEKLSLEVNLFDYQGNKIPDQLMIYLQRWIREEKKFGSLKELQVQLTEDEKNIRQLLNK